MWKADPPVSLRLCVPLKGAEEWIFDQYPPLQNITGSFFVCGMNFVGITRRIGNMVAGNNFWGINSMGLPESLAGSQRSVR